MEEFLKDVLVELIGVIGVLVTAVISIHILRSQSWGKSVSESRNNWLNQFREKVSVIVGTLATLRITQTDEAVVNKDILRAYEAKAFLYTYLNTNKYSGNEMNFPLKEMLKGIEFTAKFANNFDEVRFLDMVNLILEAEWQKVKNEAKGDIE